MRVGENSWAISGDFAAGLRQALYALGWVLVAVAATPGGWSRLWTAWAAIGCSVIALLQVCARVGTQIREEGVRPSQAAGAWMFAGFVVAGIVAWSIIGGSHAPAGQATSTAQAQEALGTQYNIVRNAVVAAVAIIIVAAVFARRSWRKRALVGRRRTSGRRRGAATRDARRDHRQTVRDPLPVRQSTDRQRPVPISGTVRQPKARVITGKVTRKTQDRSH